MVAYPDKTQHSVTLRFNQTALHVYKELVRISSVCFFTAAELFIRQFRVAAVLFDIYLSFLVQIPCSKKVQKSSESMRATAYKLKESVTCKMLKEYIDVKYSCHAHFRYQSRRTSPRRLFLCSCRHPIGRKRKADIVNIGLHFLLKNVRPMLSPVTKHSTAAA